MNIVLDVRNMGRKREAHEYLKEMLHFPEYYGDNLDALSDCLTDLDEVEVTFENTEDAGEYFLKIQRVFRDAARSNPGLTIRYASQEQQY